MMSFKTLAYISTKYSCYLRSSDYLIICNLLMVVKILSKYCSMKCQLKRLDVKISFFMQKYHIDCQNCPDSTTIDIPPYLVPAATLYYYHINTYMILIKRIYRFYTHKKKNGSHLVFLSFVLF